MSDAFLGEIRMFGGASAPKGWAFCNGQLLTIAQNINLFSLLGTTYGGDGARTFALPNLQGRVAIHQGTGPGLSARAMGESAGAAQVTLVAANLPNHSHAIPVADTAPTLDTPTSSTLGAPTTSSTLLYAPASDGLGLQMDPSASEPNPSNDSPHDNLMPYQCTNFIIALTGIFPSRS